jgi:hypothetical protein
MTLAGKAALEHAFQETKAIGSEFEGESPDQVEMPLAEMFGIDHHALLDFLETYVDDIVHGTMQAMFEGKLPQETAVLGRQMMAVMVRGLAMGVVLERARHAELVRLVKLVIAEDLFTRWEVDSHSCIACGVHNQTRDGHKDDCPYIALTKIVGVRAT